MIDFTFAELLRGFRQRASATQNTLAADLNIHPNTLSGWERGQYLPKDRDIILRLAEELALSPAETDQLLRAAEFPPAHGTPNSLTARHHLRAPVGDFVGRSAEIAALRATLLRAAQNGGAAAISGVQGMGGVGKTELAYIVAHTVRSSFPDAQIVVPLRGISATPLLPEQALQIVLRAFMPDVRLPDDLGALEALYRSQLNSKRVLILADDAQDARQIHPLLPPPGCALLVTSRQRFILPGMTTINLEQLPPDIASILLRGICPRLTADEAVKIAHACGYLPLALRISGAILHNDPALPVADYLACLADDRQRLAHLRDPDNGQLDVEATLALSYDRLDATTQRIFRHIGALVADFASGLAQAVVIADTAVDVSAVLRDLLRRNLIMYDAERVRWRLHDLVCDLARHELEVAGERDAVMWRYARAAITTAQAIQDQYQAGGDGLLAALRQFDAERVHFDAARRWAAEHAGTVAGDTLLVEDAEATRLIGKLRYDARRERIPQWKRALTAAQRLGNLRAEELALNNLGIAYYELGEAQYALPYLEQRLTIARALGDQHTEGRTLGNLALVYQDLGNVQLAIHTSEQALAISRRLGLQQDEGRALNNLAFSYMNLGQAQHAIPYLEQALVIARSLGDRRSEGIALTTLGRAYVDLGELERAIATCEEAYVIRHELGDRRGEGYALSYLARAQVFRGDSTLAMSTFTQAMTIFQDVGDRYGAAECQWLFGLSLVQHGEREQALPLLRAFLAYEQEIGHAKAEEYTALLARLEAGEELPPDLHIPTDGRAIGDERKPATKDGAAPILQRKVGTSIAS